MPASYNLFLKILTDLAITTSLGSEFKSVSNSVDILAGRVLNYVLVWYSLMNESVSLFDGMSGRLEVLLGLKFVQE
jgi:hypothetical protein